MFMVGKPDLLGINMTVLSNKVICVRIYSRTVMFMPRRSDSKLKDYYLIKFIDSAMKINADDEISMI